MNTHLLNTHSRLVTSPFGSSTKMTSPTNNNIPSLTVSTQRTPSRSNSLVSYTLARDSSASFTDSMFTLTSADEVPFPPSTSHTNILPTFLPLDAQLSLATTHNNQPPEPSLVVFSGGTAFNSIAGHVRHFTTRVTHVLPVSDDGGSTAEIVRVLGGPAVGDIRSRCLRLADDRDEEARAVKQLLAHRLPSTSASDAKREWYEIIEGEHSLWDGLSEPYKHTIRAFLIHFHVNILRHSTERFNFKSGSVGNFFFAGARLFFRSLEAAIFMFSRVARLPEGSLVLPAVCTEERITLAAELADGSLICGQNQISHPSSVASPQRVDKSTYERLTSPIRRIFYMSGEGGNHHEHEISPPANPRVLTEIAKADGIVYGIGSLYTSVCPSLILKGVGESIAARTCSKVLVLNGNIDRETSSCQAHPGAMHASDIVLAVTDTLNRQHSKKSGRLDNKPNDYVTAVLVPQGGEVVVDVEVLSELGVETVMEVPSFVDDEKKVVLYDPDALVAAIAVVVGVVGQVESE